MSEQLDRTTSRAGEDLARDAHADAPGVSGKRPAPSVASARRRVFALFVPMMVIWVVIDQLTKAYFNGSYEVGQVITQPIAGIFRFHLVYNTGGAWSIFSGATWALGAFSLVVCVALTAYLFASAREATGAEAVGLALVVAGGLGNAIDRFALGFVVDFIEPVFIDFPVFNVADIGVTCGFVIFFIALLLRERQKSKKEARQ